MEIRQSFVRFFRNGRQLRDHHLTGLYFVSLGAPSGQIERATCFESVTLEVGGLKHRVVTEKDFGGPVSMLIQVKGRPDQWFGLANVETIDRINHAEV